MNVFKTGGFDSVAGSRSRRRSRREIVRVELIALREVDKEAVEDLGSESSGEEPEIRGMLESGVAVRLGVATARL